MKYLKIVNYASSGSCFANGAISTDDVMQETKKTLGPVVRSLRASSPIWASEASLARTRERAAKPRGAGERRAYNHPLQIFICTSPRRREISLAEK